jgi:hypothetical protein
MGYGVMVLHDAENYNKIMAPCDHGALANGSIQYNHGALKLGAVQKDQIVKKLQIRFILYSSLRKGSVSVTLTGCSLQLTNAAGGAWTQTSPGGPVADLRGMPGMPWHTRVVQLLRIFGSIEIDSSTHTKSSFCLFHVCKPGGRVSLVSALCVGFHVYAHNFLPGWFVGLAHLLFHLFVRSFPT